MSPWGMTKLNVLLVDDDPVVLEALTITLSEGGHVVTPVSDGRYAIEAAEEQVFDLMITDLIMPEQEGIETIGHFKKHHPDTKIIAISGGARVSSYPYLKIARALGASQTLAKPFSATELLEAVALTTKADS